MVAEQAWAAAVRLDEVRPLLEEVLAAKVGVHPHEVRDGQPVEAVAVASRTAADGVEEAVIAAGAEVEDGPVWWALAMVGPRVGECEEETVQ